MGQIIRGHLFDLPLPKHVRAQFMKKVRGRWLFNRWTPVPPRVSFD